MHWSYVVNSDESHRTNERIRMKKMLLTLALGLALPAITLAQNEPAPPRRDRPPGREPRPEEGFGGPGRRPVPPLVAALDKNHDGVIDEQEIKDASDSLRSLDKNKDGKLTLDELRPPRPEGGDEPGARPGGPGRSGEGQPPQRGLRPPSRE
jgi:hypothetical protein